MSIVMSIKGVLAAGAITAVVSQSGLASACLSSIQTAWGLQSSCSDATTSGSSQGLFGPSRVRAVLTFGKRAMAQGLDTAGTIKCHVFDLTANGFSNGVNSSACPTTAVHHRVRVDPNT